MHCVRPRWKACAALLVALSAVALVWPADGHARPKFREGFFSAYPQLLGTTLDNVPSNAGHCGVCHYDFNGGGPKNPWGNRVLQAIQDAGCGNNDAACVSAAILAIPDFDHDGDGFWSKADELLNTTTYTNTPTFPGLSAANVDSVSNVNVNDILNHLTPTTGADTQSPVVTVTSPNGSEAWTGGDAHTVTWTATDNVAVTTVDIFYRDDELEPWTMIARNLSNSGTFQWFVHNTPTTESRVRVVARDAAANEGEDISDANFTIDPTPGGTAPTTLRDFKQPGSQPFEAGTLGDHTSCVSCHGDYDTAVEPGHNFLGMMMAQAARDPLFYACLAVAERDAPSAGDLCLRCHTPIGWLSGRSNPTDGSQLEPVDIDGVSCGFCHRMVDPVYKPGVSPTEDQAVLTMLSGHVPTTHANGQYVVDIDTRRRGPFGDPVTPHSWLESAFHRSGDFCGTCHDVSNPVFRRISGADYEPGPLDEPADSISSLTLFPLERTYSEWKNSDFVSGVYAPEFAGNKLDGIVSTCQDCHMQDVSGRGCSDVAAPIRENLPLHDFQGGNAWMPNVIASLFPGEVDAVALADGAQRAVSMLQKAATVDLDVQAVADSFNAVVTVTNRTGHKLPTGYPEGRRMWLNVVAKDGDGITVYESGAYDPATGVLTHDADAMVYEAELGISPGLAAALSTTGGKSFHFALNDSVFKDNRIPPQGFTNAAFEAFGGAPVDDSQPAPRYPDGQNWDTSTFALPATARFVKVTLYYQTTSKEYVEFLRDELQGTTSTAGQELYDAWTANGRAAPVAMAQDSMNFSPVGIALDPGSGTLSLRAARNPFRSSLELVLTLNRAEIVRLDVFDAQGRRVAHRRYGLLAPGTHRLTWEGVDGSGRDVGAGIFWASVDVGGRHLGRQVVRLR